MDKNYSDKIRDKRDIQRIREKGYLYTVTKIYVLFILAVYPLYVGKDGYNDIVNQKAYLYWIVTLVFFMAFSLFFIVYKLGSGNNEYSVPVWKRLGVPDYAAATFLVIITLSAIFSQYQDKVWLGMVNRRDGWLTYVCMLISFFIISRWYRPKQADFTIFGASSVMVCIYGFIQFFGYDFFNFFPYMQSNMIDMEGNPLYSGFSIAYRTTIGNINFVGIYVSICTILFGILYVTTKSKIRFFYLVVSALNFVLRIIAHSDAAIVGMLSAIVLLIPYWISGKNILGRFFILISVCGFAYSTYHKFVISSILPSIIEGPPWQDYYFKKEYSTLPLNIIMVLSGCILLVGLVLLLVNVSWPKMKTIQLAGVAILIGAIVGGAGVVEYWGWSLPETNIVYQAREVLHGNVDDNFGSYRMFIWKRALPRVMEIPVLGTGPDTFLEAFGEENTKEGIELHNVYYDKAHNDFIQVVLCNGVLGLVAYLILIVSTIILSVKKSFYDIFLFASMGAVLAYLGQSFFGIDTVIVTPLFWLLLAVTRGRQLQG